jgi:hypothetical protein
LTSYAAPSLEQGRIEPFTFLTWNVTGCLITLEPAALATPAAPHIVPARTTSVESSGRIFDLAVMKAER